MNVGRITFLSVAYLIFLVVGNTSAKCNFFESESEREKEEGQSVIVLVVTREGDEIDSRLS